MEDKQEIMEKKKSRRGGARPGAGHPKGNSRMISFRAPGSLVEHLEGMENRAEFIRKALTRAVKEQTIKSETLLHVGTHDEVNRVAPHGEVNSVESSGGVNSVESLGAASRGESFGVVIPVDSLPSLSLPYYDISVVAGFPVPLDNDERSQEIDILSMLCPHPEASYLIRVSGNSMIDAGVLSGDIVIVDKSNRNPSPHEIAMCELNGEYTLKHFIFEEGQGWLVPANPEYPKIRITPDDDFCVWGTVTYIIHKARD